MASSLLLEQAFLRTSMARETPSISGLDAEEEEEEKRCHVVTMSCEGDYRVVSRLSRTTTFQLSRPGKPVSSPERFSKNCWIFSCV
jgi:hypothetical protein